MKLKKEAFNKISPIRELLSEEPAPLSNESNDDEPAPETNKKVDPFRLTNEIRGELVTRTGHDLSPDDPALVLVTLNQILLPKLAAEIVESLKSGAGETISHLEEMRRLTLQSTAGDLLLLAGQARDRLRVDFSEAEAKAAQIVGGIDANLKLTRALWAFVGVIACGLFVLGALVGSVLR